MRILEPLPIAATPTIAGTAGAGSGAANLLSASPREIWLAGDDGISTIDVDMGTAVDVQGLFLGFTNATTAATWKIEKGTGLGTGLTEIMATGAFRAADSLGPGHHGFAVLDDPVNARYFRLTVTQTSVALRAGVLAIGRIFQAPYEYGSGRILIDTSTREGLPDGGFGIGAGVIKSGYRWTFIDLSAADRRELWRLTSRRGEHRPVVVDEETGEGAGLNEELHYGLFNRFEPYEREAPDQSRWALSMEDWA